MTVNLSIDQIRTITDQLDSDQLSNISKFILFVGHAHSGHSIIGATIDAHPATAIANEVNVVKLIRDHRLTKRQIESLLLSESFKNNHSESWHNSEYQYGIVNSHQGKTRKPQVIGDKKAGGSTRILFNDMWVLDYLLEIYQQNLKVVFVKRNPIDIVAAYAYYMNQSPSQFHIDRYLENLAVVEQVKRQMDENSFMQIQQEQFIQSPTSITAELLKLIDLQANKNSLKLWTQEVRSDLKGKSEQIQIPKNLSDQLP